MLLSETEKEQTDQFNDRSSVYLINLKSLNVLSTKFAEFKKACFIAVKQLTKSNESEPSGAHTMFNFLFWTGSL